MISNQQAYMPGSNKASPARHHKKVTPAHFHEMSLETLNNQNDHTNRPQYNVSAAKIQMINHLSKQLYEPAKYSLGVLYKNNRSYLKKVNGHTFIQLDLFAKTQELKVFGLGFYFFIQFLRRLTWLFFIMTLVQSYSIVINWKGSGLSNYSQTFSTYLIKTTLGNYGGNALTNFDYLVTVLSSAVNFLAIFLFYIIWKIHYKKLIREQQQNNVEIQPENFCIQIEGIDENMINEAQLTQFFSIYGPVYEVSIIKRHKNKLHYFEDLDQIQQDIKEHELQLLLGSGNQGKLRKLQQQKGKLEEQIHGLQIQPKTVSAFVHFQFEQTKKKCVAYHQDHYLQTTCSHCCVRNFLCCCVKEPEAAFLFKNKKLYLKNGVVPNPSDINWQGYQVSLGSKICRTLMAILIILVFLIISCTIIGLCSLYIVSYSSNCDNVDVNSYTTVSAVATNSEKILRCYCNANFMSSLTDSQLKNACSPYLVNIYIEQVIQYVVIIASSIINVIFGLLINKLVHCMQPTSKSTALTTKTVIYTIFIVINTIFIPILIYGDIYGFKASSYVSLLTIISTDVKNIFLIQNLDFYPNFTNIWYRNVSSIFTNFLIINTLTTWVMYFVTKCWNDTTGLKEQEGKILQKHLNAKMTSYQVQIYKEAAYLYMTLIMICLFYTGIPVLIPIGFLNILSRYITIRSLLQSYSVRIDGLTEHFLSFSVTILIIILLICPLMGEWMLIAHKGIFPILLPYGNPFPLTTFMGLFKQLDMQLYLPFYISISFVVLCQWIITNTVISFCYSLCKCCCYEKEPVYHSKPFSQYAKSINLLCSYNIRNNDQMRNAILNLEKYLVNKGAI